MQGAVRFLHIPCCEVVKMIDEEILKFVTESWIFGKETNNILWQTRITGIKNDIKAMRKPETWKSDVLGIIEKWMEYGNKKR